MSSSIRLVPVGPVGGDVNNPSVPSVPEREPFLQRLAEWRLIPVKGEPEHPKGQPKDSGSVRH
jgi:hypothetical protein